MKKATNKNTDNEDARQAVSAPVPSADEGALGHSKLWRIWTLFYSMLYISSCTFGGGFVIVTFMKRRFADELHWIDNDEILDMTAIAQSSPGAIAVNAAILVGWRVGGFFGMVAAVLGTIIPPMLILGVISLFYSAFATNKYVSLVLNGMQSGVAAVICDVVCRLGAEPLRERDVWAMVIMPAAFIAVFFFGVNVIWVILAAGACGVCRALIARRRKARGGE